MLRLDKLFLHAERCTKNNIQIKSYCSNGRLKVFPFGEWRTHISPSFLKVAFSTASNTFVGPITRLSSARYQPFILYRHPNPRKFVFLILFYFFSYFLFFIFYFIFFLFILNICVTLFFRYIISSLFGWWISNVILGFFRRTIIKISSNQIYG